MGGGVKVAVAALAVASGALAPPARADLFGTQDTNVGRFGDAFERTSHWLVGVTLGRAAGFTRLDEEDVVDDQFFGLSVAWHRSWLGVHGELSATPQRRARRNRAHLVLGTRLQVTALGRELSYGINVQGEANLRDHNWFVYVTPIEIGGDLYTRNTFHVQLFVGARYALAGALIKNMFIDPNGIESEVFEKVVRDKEDSPWEGYVTLVFGRRLH